MQNLHQTLPHVKSPSPAVRDSRRRNYFWADNRFMDEVAPSVGATAVAIYMLLCRLADDSTQTCYPAVDFIAEKLNLSKPTVKAHLKTLAAACVIQIVPRKSETGTSVSNEYVLLDMEHWNPDAGGGKETAPRGKNLAPTPKNITGRGKSEGQNIYPEQYKDLTTSTASGPDEAPEPALELVAQRLAAHGLDRAFVAKLPRYESGARHAAAYIEQNPQFGKGNSKLIWDAVANPERYALKTVAAPDPKLVEDLPPEWRDQVRGWLVAGDAKVTAFAAEWELMSPEEQQERISRLRTNEPFRIIME